MGAINTPPNPLDYAPSARSTDSETARGAEELRFDLGPETTALLIARVLPWCLLAGLAAGACFWSAVARHGLFPGIGLWVPLLTAAATSLWRLARYRHVPRTVGVADGQVFYADARTRGQPFGVRPSEVKALRVQRRWWRPGVFELTTVPRLILGIGTTNPVVLVYSLDRGSLDKICRELTAALWP